MGHQPTLWLELPIKCWVLSDPMSQIGWKWYLQDWALGGSEGTSRLHEQVTQTPSHLPWLPESSSLRAHLWLYGTPCKTKWKRRRKPDSFHGWVSSICGCKRNWTVGALQPHTAVTLKDSNGGKSSCQSFEQCTGHLLGVERRSDPRLDYIVANGLASWLGKTGRSGIRGLG